MAASSSSSQRNALSAEQELALNIAVREKHSVFITGCAGTGKSFLLKRINQALKKSGRTVYKLAPTAAAAVLIKGCTLHQFFRIKPKPGPARDDYRLGGGGGFPKEMKGVDVLLIDEVSMIDRHMFDLIDQLLMKARNVPKPFGGVQIVAFGDFMQLPPVWPEEQYKVSERQFAFESDTWKSIFPFDRCIELTIVWRQADDPAYIEALQRFRKGVINHPGDLGLMQRRVRAVFPDDGIEPTILRSRNYDVDSINKSRLQRLERPEHSYQKTQTVTLRGADTCSRGSIAMTKAESSEVERMHKIMNSHRSEKTLLLRVGAQVTMLCNAYRALGGNIVNGSRGVVVGFAISAKAAEDEETDSGPTCPIVRFINGKELEISLHCWEIESNLNSNVVGYIRQVPLKLAWAMTIHSCQGATIERVSAKIDTSIRNHGQAYVALSRVKTLDSMTLETFNPAVLKSCMSSSVLEWVTALDNYQAHTSPFFPLKRKDSEEEDDATHKKQKLSDTTE